MPSESLYFNEHDLYVAHLFIITRGALNFAKLFICPFVLLIPVLNNFEPHLCFRWHAGVWFNTFYLEHVETKEVTVKLLKIIKHHLIK